MIDPAKLTWTCHVCREERPDARISVLTRDRVVRGISFRENVRYCNDRPSCLEGAARVLFVPEEA